MWVASSSLRRWKATSPRHRSCAQRAYAPERCRSGHAFIGVFLGLILAHAAPDAALGTPATCTNAIVGPTDVLTVIARIFSAAVDVRLLDANDDGRFSAADIVGTVQRVSGCAVAINTGSLRPAAASPSTYLVVNRFGSTTPAGTGAFTVTVEDDRPTATYAVSESGAVYAAVTMGSEHPVVLDALSTARALVALNPLLAPESAAAQATILDMVESSAAVSEVARQLERAYANGGEVSEDAGVIDALAAAIVEILEAIAATDGLANGAPINPGECLRNGRLDVCNFDMLSLTMANSTDPVLRIEPASAGPLRLQTNVDWVARIVELDPDKVPGIGGRYVFFPDEIDPAFEPDGFDREVVVRGSISSGWFTYVVDPIGSLIDRLVADDFSPGNVSLPGPGLYAVVAFSGTPLGDASEYRAVSASPWQTQLWRRALKINGLAAALDAIGLAFPVAGSELLDAFEAAEPGIDLAIAAIDDRPDRVAEAVAQILLAISGRVVDAYARTVAVRGARQAALKGFLKLWLAPIQKVVATWSRGFQIGTRLGGMLLGASPREAGYAVVRGQVTGGTTYVTSSAADNVSVIDPVAGVVVDFIIVGDEPMGIAALPDSSAIYVANARSRTVSVISPSTNAVEATINLDGSPELVASAPDSRHVYVTGSRRAGLESFIAIIDTAINEVAGTLEFGVTLGLRGLAVSRDSNTLYVSTDDVLAIDFGDDMIEEVELPFPLSAGDLALAPNSGRLFVGSRARGARTDYLSAITLEPFEFIGSVGLPRFVGGVAVKPDETEIYVASSDADIVTVVSSDGESTEAIPVGRDPGRVAFSRDGRWALVANGGDDTVSVIDTATRTVARTVTVGRSPFGIATVMLPQP